MPSVPVARKRTKSSPWPPEYGFSITEADYRAASERASVQKTALPAGELAEEELEAAAGGNNKSPVTENRYDPEVCGKYTETHYNCVGFLGFHWCDHLRVVFHGASQPTNRKTCVMGYFDYHFH